MDFASLLISRVEVRRNNGQCAYGPWLPVSDADVPAWVGDAIADEIAEHDADEGEVEQGGCTFTWRKA